LTDFFAPAYRYILASVGRREDAEDLAAEAFVNAPRARSRWVVA
jgi:DNA-directed RNA polymerase specialized sigma24 family protein